ncbi:unnamed protein product [Calypogeia fissa]
MASPGCWLLSGSEYCSSRHNSCCCGIGATIASKQEGAPYTLKNLIAVCIVTELLQLLSLGRKVPSTHIPY